MRCYICDRVIDEPNFNSDHEDYEPCDSCLRVIEDTLASFESRPAVAEDDLLTDDILEFFYRACLPVWPGQREEDYE